MLATWVEVDAGLRDESKIKREVLIECIEAWVAWQNSAVGFNLSGMTMASFLNVYDGGGRFCQVLKGDEQALRVERAMRILKAHNFRWFVAVVLYYSESTWSNPMCAKHLNVSEKVFVNNKLAGEGYLDALLFQQI